MNDIQGYQNGPVESGASRAKEMSPRAYNLTMSALIFLGFCAMGAGAYFTSTMSFARMMMSGAALPLVFGSFILTIVGMVMMSAAASKQSVGLSLVGYVIFASTFGLTASFGLANYDLPTINTAFIATAAITFVFGALGVTFPKFFQRVYGIGFGILLATILVEIVLMFMGVSQTITDLIVIVVFAGFIGYDTYVATTVPPTLPNAVLMASNLFVDIINVFLRILNILGRRDEWRIAAVLAVRVNRCERRSFGAVFFVRGGVSWMGKADSGSDRKGDHLWQTSTTGTVTAGPTERVSPIPSARPVPRPPSVTWQLCPKRAPRISSVRLPACASSMVCLPVLSRR